jgi:DNA end-binding protein Ku
VCSSDLDTVLFEQPYFLEPIAGAEKAYSLLGRALNKAKKTGVAKFVFSNRERLGLIRAADGLLWLEQIRYKAEVRDPAELKIPAADLGTADELAMAEALISQLTKPFDAAAYHDTYREDIERIVAEKVAGRRTTAVGAAPEPTRAKDLMQTLLASLDKTREPAGKH